MNTIKAYYQLTKPGIIYGNLMTALAGFLLASSQHLNGVLVHISILAAVLVGTGLVIASGCVFNNYIDRDLDKHMARTKKRALVTGKISGPHALVYASLLALAGFAVLALYTNALTVWVGAVGFIDYVVLYAVSKRKSTLGTIVGSVSGATPILAGYTAAANVLDAGAILIFLGMIIWQMPHFYAIAIYRLGDYKAAKLPVLPAVRGTRITKTYILVYILAYGVVTALLTGYGITGRVFQVVMFLVTLRWFILAVQGFQTSNDTRWARKMFGFSLIVLLVFSVLIAANAFLP